MVAIRDTPVAVAEEQRPEEMPTLPVDSVVPEPTAPEEDEEMESQDEQTKRTVEMYWTEENPLVLMAFAMKTGRILTGYIASDPDPKPDREGRTLLTLYILREGELSDL